MRVQTGLLDEQHVERLRHRELAAFRVDKGLRVTLANT